jgi:hypothetical protein
MSIKSATPASVILEVVARVCGQPVRRNWTLVNDLLFDEDDLIELRAALELALKCELGDFEIDGGITVADLIERIVTHGRRRRKAQGCRVSRGLAKPPRRSQTVIL